MTNPEAGSGGIGFQSSSRILAAGGAVADSDSRKESSARSLPKASMVTPRLSLQTRPANPFSRARR